MTQIIHSDGKGPGTPMTEEQKRKAGFLPRRSVVRDGTCEYCTKWGPAEGKIEIFPHHDASPRCQSGKHSHCTCDTCF